MERDSRELSAVLPDFLGVGRFDPIEEGIRGRVRGFIGELVEAELNEALGRSRYQRPGTRARRAERVVTGTDGGNASCLARSAR